ncbi:TPA: hypothetical protein ACIVZW_005085, partial [Salmonella enterica subsp. enterica serovar Oranienburg]
MNKYASLSFFTIFISISVFAETDTSFGNMPYIGEQTENTSSAYNNNQLRTTNVDPWGEDVTNVTGPKLGYIVPEDTTKEGGLWAGTKAAGVTFGSPSTGLIVDQSGAKIKNSNLDMTGNAISNLKEGVENEDAVNVSQLKTTAKETLSKANAYSDSQSKETLG